MTQVNISDTSPLLLITAHIKGTPGCEDLTEGGKAGDTIAVVIVSGLPVYLLWWRGTAMGKQRHYKWQR